MSEATLRSCLIKGGSCDQGAPRWGTTVDSHSYLSRFAPLYACHAGWAD